MEEDSILYELILPQASIPDEILHMEYETPIIEGAHKTANVKRKPAWSDLEQEILLKEVSLREKRLFGKFKGSGRGKKERGEEWEEVARAINEIGICLRTGKEAAKQYANMKSRAKEKISQFKRMPTGGGPKPPSPTPLEQTLLSSLEGRPSLQGLSEGFDTGDMETEREQIHSMAQSASTSVQTARSQTKGQTTKEKTLLSLQKEVLLLEKKKMEKD